MITMPGNLAMALTRLALHLKRSFCLRTTDYKEKKGGYIQNSYQVTAVPGKTSWQLDLQSSSGDI